ncbi:MAG: hypothetical protein BGO43_05595 [Gammaproteobacteria bacterium 39-13]|nr:(Fe-S)-binding protein [Gammaproteobacteria bacterium]OJV91512.1 MAG: hypothetical protein BGO43_05595 [Gammaproteobacteria bacterium 39-13]
MEHKESSSKLAQTVSDYASQCVKCALCLPHCPTYLLTKDENESPRGRIALFQALAQEKLPLSEKAQTHLDQCLGCRACERVCPAHVEYGQLLTFGRTLLKQLPSKGPLPKTPFTTRFLSWIATKPSLLRALHWLLWGLDKSGLRRLARFVKLPSLFGLSSLDNLLSGVSKPYHFQPHYAAIGTERGSVMLFTGCISSLCDQETLAASIYVLRHLGMDVYIPSSQTCCGAIASHAGDMAQAYHLAKQNNQALMGITKKVDYVITTATGCSAVLQEYATHFSSDTNLEDATDLSSFSHKVMDIVTFIQHHEWPLSVIPKPLPLRVMLHTPCTRRNVLKSTADPEQLLARIPELTWKSFRSTQCCGAAGTYMLDHPDLAEPLAKQLLSELDDIQVDYIATSNIGCALHLQKQLKTRNPAITLGHPVILLARALGF